MKKLIILLALTFFLYDCNTDDHSTLNFDGILGVNCFNVRLHTKNCLGDYLDFPIWEEEFNRLRDLEQTNSGCFPVEVENLNLEIIEGFLDLDSEILPTYIHLSCL